MQVCLVMDYSGKNRLFAFSFDPVFAGHCYVILYDHPDLDASTSQRWELDHSALCMM